MDISRYYINVPRKSNGDANSYFKMELKFMDYLKNKPKQEFSFFIGKGVK